MPETLSGAVAGGGRFFPGQSARVSRVIPRNEGGRSESDGGGAARNGKPGTTLPETLEDFWILVADNSFRRYTDQRSTQGGPAAVDQFVCVAVAGYATMEGKEQR